MIATCWTSAGDASPKNGSGVSPVPIEERIRAVADTGWAGIGFAQNDLFQLRETIGFAALRRHIDRAGLRHTEIELIENWWIPRGADGNSYHVREMLFEAADALSPAHIKVGSAVGSPATSHDMFVGPLRELGEQAAGHGTRIALEPMPFAVISTVPAGAKLVRAVNHPSVGLMVDSWHVFRGGTSLEELRSCLSAEMVFGVELDDADESVVGTLFEDTVDNRRLPGDGVFDNDGLITVLRDIGYSGGWGVEMIARDYRSLPHDVALARAYETGLRAVLG